MKKLYGLAALIGAAAGAAIYLKKVGALTITDTETEDGGHKYGVEVKLPRRKAAEEYEDFEEYDEEEFEEEAEEEYEEGEEETGEEEEDRKIGFSFTVGPEATAKLGEVKDLAKQVKEAAVNAAQGLKDTITGAVRNAEEEVEEAFEDAEEDGDLFTEVEELTSDAVEDIEDLMETIGGED